jgi:ABC-type Zn2+ transport system substrate-binding protein/surface adhesin
MKVDEQEVADDDRENRESDENETNDSETDDDIENDKDEASENESDVYIDLFEIPKQAKTINSTIFQLIKDELTENRFVVITGNIRNYLNKIIFQLLPVLEKHY